MKKLPFTILNSNEIYAINSRIVEACKQTNGNDEYLMKLCMLLDRRERRPSERARENI